MTSNEIRASFQTFFKMQDHVIIPSASLVPENDPTVLFTTAGMQPLVPFLLGETHPQGTRLANIQKCLRTGDIEDVGDASHGTFFEMIGFWSLGDYFKKEAISWVWEWYTSDEWLGIPKDRLAVTVFEGDADAPRDEEAAKIWKSIGMDRITYLGKSDNWWGPAGTTGPCGPDSEIFYDTEKPACGDLCQPGCDCGKWMEIGNVVFMQYFKDKDGTISPAPQKNIDTGLGLERLAMVMQDKETVYETDLYEDLLNLLKEKATKQTTRSIRIIADHMKASTMLISDGVQPSNVDQGYILRRLLRRALRHANAIGLDDEVLVNDVPQQVIKTYEEAYPELKEQQATIIEEIKKEIAKFKETLRKGEKELDRQIERLGEIKCLSGEVAFYLYESYGFPLELTVEYAKEHGLEVDEDSFQTQFEEHQARSRKGAEKKFAGGLADHSEITVRYHTATHLLHQALREVLGDHVEQKGSNITDERLRFDFTHPEKMTPEQLKEVEDIVNEKIRESLPITMQEMSLDLARSEGAIGLFGDKYGEKVKVYHIGDYSKEICGGPHVTNTAEIGTFRIVKESSSSQGVRRIKAVVDNAPITDRDIAQ